MRSHAGISSLLLMMLLCVVVDGEQECEATAVVEKESSKGDRLYPHACLHNPYAKGSQERPEGSDLKANLSCYLTFEGRNVDGIEENILELCKAVYMDSYHSHRLINSTLVCAYERLYYCNSYDAVMVDGKCFWLSPTVFKSFKKSLHRDMGRTLEGTVDHEMAGEEELSALKYLIAFDHIEARICEGTVRVGKATSADYLWVNLDKKAYTAKFKKNTGDDSALAIRVTRDPLGPERIGDIVELDANMKLAHYVYISATLVTAGVAQFCGIIDKEFRIPAAFESGSCFIESTSYFSARASKSGYQLGHLHNSCQYFKRLTMEALSVTSQGKHKGMDHLISHLPEKSTGLMLLPGRREKVESMPKSVGTLPDAETQGIKKLFYYVASNNKAMARMLHSGWKKGYPSYRKADMKGSVALHDGEGFMDVPPYVRAQTACTFSVISKDQSDAKCPDEWTASERDDGTTICYKMFDVPEWTEKFNYPYEKAKEFCNAHGGATLAPIQSEKEQNISFALADAQYNKMKGVAGFNSGKEHAIWLGAEAPERNTPYIWEYDKSTMYYTYWAPNEPTFGDGRNPEKCLEIYLVGDATKHGYWNDIQCGGTSRPGRFVGILCAKMAEPSVRSNEKGE